jgi:hypothetical protein
LALKSAPTKPPPAPRSRRVSAPPKFFAPAPPAVSKLPAPAEMSAPAQKPRPSPVRITARMASSSSARTIASASSAPIWAV